MPIRYYSFEDAGAPQLPNVSTQRTYDSLCTVLKACLVTGYGSKPGAGWTIGHEHADGISFGNGRGFLNLVAEGTQRVSIYIMETITNGSAALAQGYNRRSGEWYEGQATGSRQILYLPGLQGTTASKAWAVVADEKSVILSAGATALVDVQNSNGVGLYFGDFIGPGDVPIFGSFGGRNMGPTSSSASNLLAHGAIVCGCVLRHPATGLIDQGVAPIYGLIAPSEDGVQSVSLAKPAPLVTRLRSIRCGITGFGAGVSGGTSWNASVTVGLSRGMVAFPDLTSTYLSKVLPALGKASPVWQDRYRLITLPDGKQILPLNPHTSDLLAFVSLDPADWE